MSNPNKDKPKLTTEPVRIAETVHAAPEEITEEEFVSIAGLASQGREKLLDALRAHNEKHKPVEPAPAVLTDRQMERTRLEMEAGRRTAERNAARAAFVPQPKPDPTEGYTTPVYRPGDHVPSMNSGDLGARTVK